MTGKSCSDIARRVAAVRERVEKAAARAGRSPAEITLVGVTKTRTATEVREVIKAGVCVIGENRVGELLEKEPFLADLPHEAHLIGHLQRNKAKLLPGHITMLQSLASEETVLSLEKAYAGAAVPLDVLIEVNIGDEASKSGIDRGGVEALAERIAACPALRLRGLMAIPPPAEGARARVYFEQMRHIFVDIRAKRMDNVNVLSMGMSSDFEEAILEGATMIRVGSELFGQRRAT